MNKTVKYLLIAASSLVILVIVAIVAVTTMVDVESYKPKIEQLVTEKTGYPLTLGGKIELSLFPWVGLGFTDLQLGNPQGFVGKTFVHIDGFQARLKLLPLLSKKVEMSSFVIKRPEIFFERSPKGVWNWQKLTEQGTSPKSSEAAKSPSAGGGNQGAATAQEGGGEQSFALQSLVVGEFSISDGRVRINDLQNKQQREISDFNLQLADVSLDKPIKMTMGAAIDGKPLKVNGSIGPLGSDPGAGKTNLDLVIEALDTAHIQISGYLADLKSGMSYNMAVSVEPFSLKKLLSSLGQSMPVTTSDPKALEKISLKANIAGDTKQVTLSKSNILLDDTSIDVDLSAKDFAKPDLAFTVAVDSIDVDRYLPPQQAEDKQTSGGATAPATPSARSASSRPAEKAGVNYDPLRKLVLKGMVKVGKIKVHGGTLSNLALDVTGKNGLFNINSLGMDLYQGKLASTGKLNVQKNIPATSLNLNLQGVQVGPLLKDFAKKEIIEGLFKADLALTLQGDNADLIKRSLSGKGDLLFKDGALIGIDLAKMARSIKSGFTLEQQGEKPKTDFAELHAPFTITSGLVNTPETTLRSPFIRVNASGDANLVSEALDLKIKPTLVASMKGQGDQEQRSGITVPVLVGGTFQAPKFSPDLQSMVKDQMPTEKELGEMIKSGKLPEERKEKLKQDLEQAKGLFKGLLGN